MIKTGTFWQFYQSNGYNPVCLYAASKQAFQTLCEYYVQAHVFRLLHLYLFDTYGPGDTCRKLIHLVAGHAGKSEVLPMSPGEQRVNLLHISDVVNGFEAAIGIRLHDFEAGSLRYALAHDE
jgi:nucleoside-diphosphate-sugar epimerase